MPEDVAIASRKSEVNTCTDDRDIDRPKSADRQTDGFSALYSRKKIDICIKLFTTLVVHQHLKFILTLSHDKV